MDPQPPRPPSPSSTHPHRLSASGAMLRTLPPSSMPPPPPADSAFVPVSLTPPRAAPIHALCRGDLPRFLSAAKGRGVTRMQLGGLRRKDGSAATIERKAVEQKSTAREKKPAEGNKYAVYIVNDDFNKKERVVGVLLKTVEGLTFSRAHATMDEAHTNGLGHVTTVVQELAEHYCSCICGEGILSIIRPED